MKHQSFLFLFTLLSINILLLYLIPFISSSGKFGTITNEILTCSSPRPMGEVCALYIDSPEEPGVKSYIIKDRCSDSALCTENPITESKEKLQCIDIIKAKRPKQKCTYDSDCVTNICYKGKCGTLKVNSTCEHDFPQCGPNLSCPRAVKKCVPLLKEGELCEDDHNSCQYGTKCNSISHKCEKIGSRSSGDQVGTEYLLCESGIQYNGICVDVKDDGKCELENGVAMCKGLNLTEKNKMDFPYNDDLECTAYYGNKLNETNYVCNISIAKSMIFKRYLKKMERYVEDIDEKNDFIYDEGNTKYNFGKKDLAREDILYYNADEFQARGLLDDKGEIAEDKKCEGEWLLKYLGGNKATTIKVNSWIFGSLILALLI